MIKGYTLSVGIPTYRRRAAVLRRIAEVESIGGLIDSMLIVDNDPEASPILLGSVKGIYSKNRANIGACANILRVVELAQSDFLWLRGDDDCLQDEVAQKATKALNAGFEIVILTSRSGLSFEGRGLVDFITCPDAIRSAKWISAVIVPSLKARLILPVAYLGVPSGWPHLTLLIGILQEFPATRFTVISCAVTSSGFRDIGREEGMKYAFFRTSFELFPDTAVAIANRRQRGIYLDSWRAGVDVGLGKTLIKSRLGFIASENLSINTFSSLFSVGRPRTWFVWFYFMSIFIVPKMGLRVALSLALRNKSAEWREGVGFGVLGNTKSLLKIYTILKTRKAPVEALHVY